MKIVLIIQDEPIFLPVALKRLIGYGINLNYVIKLNSDRSNIIEKIKKHLILLGFFDFIKLLFLNFFLNMRDIFLNQYSNLRSIDKICKKNKISKKDLSDINSYDSKKLLKSLNPDLIISLSAPQIFDEELLAIPNIGIINLHGSYLPSYQGLMPSFWQLYNNENELGTTVHEISKRVDAGNIISQVKFSIDKIKTQYSLINKSKKIGIFILKDSIERIKKRKKLDYFKLNNPEQGKYFGWPTSKESKTFRKQGNNFITFKELIRNL